MKRMAVALALALAACIYPGKSTRTERLTAASEERVRYCSSDAESGFNAVLANVEAAQPLYAKLRTGPRNIYTYKLVGARFEIRARDGWTAEGLEQVLRCHQARGAAGDLSPAETDPFALAEGWIDIRVQSEKGHFLVSARGQTEDESRLIDSRAQEFIAIRGMDGFQPDPAAAFCKTTAVDPCISQ